MQVSTASATKIGFGGSCQVGRLVGISKSKHSPGPSANMLLAVVAPNPIFSG